MNEQELDERELEEEDKKHGNLPALDKYWQGKMGDAPKGSFRKAVKIFKRHPDKIDNPEALAAWWHLRTTGMTPTQKYKAKGWKIHHHKKGESK